ncbi:transposase [Fictibacillus enclensis]|nr:transposase [Fictibacillus enclensis]MDM5339052.1 transposase [Fictibacillus enclensis]
MVSGLGDDTIVDLLSEIGSFSHYQNPRQLIKLAGLTLIEKSCGAAQGTKTNFQAWKKTAPCPSFPDHDADDPP